MAKKAEKNRKKSTPRNQIGRSTGRNRKKSRQPKKDRHNKSAIEGAIKISSMGSGFIDIPAEGRSIEVPARLLNTALHGDLVIVQPISEAKKGGALGEVVRVVSRKKKYHVGVIRERNGIYFLEPDDSRMYISIIIPERDLDGAKPGEKVAVEITSWEKTNEEPIGRVIKVLGMPGLHETEMQSIVYDKGIVTGFPKHIEEEAEHVRDFLNNTDINDRRDLRNVPTMTIDPKTAKDFDDALSIQTIKEGVYEVGIHIADVSYFVRPGTELDREARRRGTSTYLVDRTIPMLPRTLSDDLCSLNPNEDKLAYSAIFHITDEGDVIDEWFGRTRIHSDKRFSYEEAQSILDAEEGAFYHELSLLNTLAEKFREKKFAEGAIEFHGEEYEFVMNENMRIVEIIKKERLDTHKLIEDFMLLANKRVAEFIYRQAKKTKKDIPFVYRVHDLPDRDKVLRVVTLLRKLGYDIRIGNRITQEDINTILDTVRDTPEESLIHTATIQSMTKAIYTTKNIGHFGLAFSHYTHFTSPIRRYADVLVHRLLAAYCNGETVKTSQLEELETITAHVSATERTAEEAERDSRKYKRAEYMREHIGKEFSGVISGVVKWGIFVKEKTTGSEGLVSVRDLPDDYYIYDEDHIALIGKSSQKMYQLGDTVSIRVKSVDPRKREINYTLT